MILKYNITGGARSAFANIVAEIVGHIPIYQGTPSFAFAVGGCIIDRYGNLHCPPGSGGEAFFSLIAELRKRGYVAENEPTPPNPSTETSQADTAKFAKLVIELPRDGLDDEKVENLRKIIQSKASLIRASIGENLASTAHTLPVETSDEKVSFPWFAPESRAEEITAYSHLLIKLCTMARQQKYVSAREREVENQKYAFRCFLLRLGFIGSEYGEARKILLANLTGNGSRRGDETHARENEADETPVGESERSGGSVDEKF